MRPKLEKNGTVNIMDKHKSTQIKQHWIKFIKNEQMDDILNWYQFEKKVEPEKY